MPHPRFEAMTRAHVIEAARTFTPKRIQRWSCVVPVDGTIVAGDALVYPWLGATESVKRREGDSLLSGARLVSGKVRVRAAYTGLDRAWTLPPFVGSAQQPRRPDRPPQCHDPASERDPHEGDDGDDLGQPRGGDADR